jgi:hypothetical protein
MIFKFNFKKLLIVLFSFSLLLLLSHLILSLVFPGTSLSKISVLSTEEIDKKFKESLYSFALKDEWIKTVKDKSSVLSYRINVPSDLPIAQIINELTKQYSSYGITVIAEEKKINGKTLMQVLSDTDIKVKADFRYDENIQRTESKSALFIFGRENKELEYDSLLRNLPRDYSALLVPSKSASAFARWLKENGFDYAVMFKDDNSELEFRLDKDYSEKRVKLIIQNLVVSFPNALFYVLGKSSNLYSSQNYQLIKKEFAKRKIRFFSDDSLKFIDSNHPKIKERLNSLVRNVKADDTTRIAISFDAYQSLSGELNKLLRIGYKFVKMSELESRGKK